MLHLFLFKATVGHYLMDSPSNIIHPLSSCWTCLHFDLQLLMMIGRESDMFVLSLLLFLSLIAVRITYEICVCIHV